MELSEGEEVQDAFLLCRYVGFLIEDVNGKLECPSHGPAQECASEYSSKQVQTLTAEAANLLAANSDLRDQIEAMETEIGQLRVVNSNLSENNERLLVIVKAVDPVIRAANKAWKSDMHLNDLWAALGRYEKAENKVR